MSRAKRATYVPPHRYTDAELREATRADLRTDIRCAIRDGLTDYAAECQRALEELDK